MNAQNKLSAIAKTLLLSIAAFSTGCDSADTEAQPVQLVEMGISDNVVRNLVIAADLQDALEVADFHIRTPQDGDIHTLPGTSPLGVTSEYDTSTGLCQRQEDGQVFCIDFSGEPPTILLPPAEVPNPIFSAEPSGA